MRDDDDREDRPRPEWSDEFLRVGGLVDESVVTLAIYGEKLDPSEITQALRCDPTSSHKKGDPKSGCSTPRSKGAWLLCARGVAPRSPADLVRSVLARVSTDEELWVRLSRRFDVQLRFGIFQEAWNRGFDLPADLLADIHRIHASCEFDIYANVGGGETS